jgi:hypothetical protein
MRKPWVRVAKRALTPVPHVFPEKESKVKFAVDMPYGAYVMDQEDALRLVDILSRAEKYETNYRPATEGGPTYHVYQEQGKTGMTLRHIPDNLYQLARLAGPSKPE